MTATEIFMFFVVLAMFIALVLMVAADDTYDILKTREARDDQKRKEARSD